jgi:hypothetical protein
VKAVEYEEGLKILKSNPVCAECGTGMSLFWGGAWKIESYVIGCVTNKEHDGIARPARISNYDLPGYNMPGVIRRRENELETKVGPEKTKALVRAAGGNVMSILTEKGAVAMLTILYPDAAKNPSGQAAIIKGALICRDYGLNPAMDHIFLVKYDHYEGKGENRHKTGEDWAVVRGIKASRLISGRDKSYGYIDDTPRIMTEDEQKRIFGEVDTESLVAICKLKDKDGNIFSGYGKWSLWKKYGDKKYPNEPMGTEKGNSKINQAFIRAERQSLDKMNPGAMPPIDVVDETYMTSNKVVVQEVGKVDKDTGEITEEPPTTEGEFTEAIDQQNPGDLTPEQREILSKAAAEESIKTLGDFYGAVIPKYFGYKLEVLTFLKKKEADLKDFQAEYALIVAKCKPVAT